MYPVIRGNAGFGGEISSRSIKHLLVEFNCLGKQGEQMVNVVIPVQNDKYLPISLTFKKQCSGASIFHSLEQKLKTSPVFDFGFILFIAFVGFNIKFGFEYASKKLTPQKKNDIILGLKLVREKTIPVVHNIQRFLIEKIVGNQNVKSSWAGGNPPKGHRAYNPAFDEDVEIEVGCSVRGQMLNN